MFLLDLIGFIDDAHGVFGRDGRKAWPGCFMIVAGTVLGIWVIYELSMG